VVGYKQTFNGRYWKNEPKYKPTKFGKKEFKHKNDRDKSIKMVSDKYKEILDKYPETPFDVILRELTDWAMHLPMMDF